MVDKTNLTTEARRLDDAKHREPPKVRRAKIQAVLLAAAPDHVRTKLAWWILQSRMHEREQRLASTPARIDRCSLDRCEQTRH